LEQTLGREEELKTAVDNYLDISTAGKYRNKFN
jgi:hypothetical protein